ALRGHSNVAPLKTRHVLGVFCPGGPRWHQLVRRLAAARRRVCAARGLSPLARIMTVVWPFDIHATWRRCALKIGHRNQAPIKPSAVGLISVADATAYPQSSGLRSV